MRTRSNVYFGSGMEGAIRSLKNLYPAGRVCVLCEDEAEGELWCESLTEQGYIARILREKDTEDFLLCVGSEGSIYAAIGAAKGKFALCPTTLLPEFFVENAWGKVAEFSYFDTDFFNCDNHSVVSECYAGLFCAATQAFATLYAETGSPFCDKSLLAASLRAKEILLGGTDRAAFLSECVSVTKTLSECLFDRGVRGFCATDMAKTLGGGVKNRNISAYFLNRLLILFTKWDFRDMLIATVETSAFSAAYGKKDLVFSSEELSRVAGIVKKDVEKPDLRKMVAAMESAVFNKNDLFCEIFSRGLPEGLVGYD